MELRVINIFFYKKVFDNVVSSLCKKLPILSVNYIEKIVCIIWTSIGYILTVKQFGTQLHMLLEILEFQVKKIKENGFDNVI